MGSKLHAGIFGYAATNTPLDTPQWKKIRVVPFCWWFGEKTGRRWRRRPALPISKPRIPSLHLQASLPLLSCLFFCLDLLYFYYQCVFSWSLHDHAMRFWKWHNCSFDLMVCNFSTHIVMQMYICWAVPLSSLQSCVLDMDCFSNTTIMT